MDENITNRKMNETRHIQAIQVLSTLTAIFARGGCETRSSVSTVGRLECLPFARAEAQVFMGRWNA